MMRRACSCSPLPTESVIHIEDTTPHHSSINGFFYDDPNISYTAPQEHTFDQSPCRAIVAIKQGYFYCKLHPDIKDAYLELIEHHIKYKDPQEHRSELLKLLNIAKTGSDLTAVLLLVCLISTLV